MSKPEEPIWNETQAFFLDRYKKKILEDYPYTWTVWDMLFKQRIRDYLWLTRYPRSLRAYRFCIDMIKRHFFYVLHVVQYLIIFMVFVYGLIALWRYVSPLLTIFILALLVIPEVGNLLSHRK